jgi:hypothetical protein
MIARKHKEQKPDDALAARMPIEEFKEDKTVSIDSNTGGAEQRAEFADYNQFLEITEFVESLATDCITGRRPSLPKLDNQLTIDDQELRYATKLAIFHLLRECIEVISWMAKSKDEYRIIFYNNMDSCIKYAVENISEIDKRYFPQNSFYAANTDALKVSCFEKGTEQNDLKIFTSRNTKVYLPNSYGFRKKIYLNELIRLFRRLGIESVFPCLGPHEPCTSTLEENEIIEKESINDWFADNQGTLEGNKVKVVVYDKKTINKAYHHLIEAELYKSGDYQNAKKALIAMVLKIKTEAKYKEFKEKIHRDVVSHVLSAYKLKVQPKPKVKLIEKTAPNVQPIQTRDQKHEEIRNNFAELKDDLKWIKSRLLYNGFKEGILKLDDGVLDDLWDAMDGPPEIMSKFSDKYEILISKYPAEMTDHQYKAAQVELSELFENTIVELRLAAVKISAVGHYDVINKSYIGHDELIKDKYYQAFIILFQKIKSDRIISFQLLTGINKYFKITTSSIKQHLIGLIREAVLEVFYMYSRTDYLRPKDRLSMIEQTSTLEIFTEDFSNGPRLFKPGKCKELRRLDKEKDAVLAIIGPAQEKDIEDMLTDHLQYLQSFPAIQTQ